MHIVMLSDWETRGGAAIAASRLAQALAAQGHRVTRLVAFPDRAAHHWATRRLAPPLFNLRRALRSRLAPGPRAQLDQTARPWAQRRLGQLLAALRPDVINLHNLHGGIGAGWSPEMARVCAAHAPVVWTFHDMSPFTGRCVYSGPCRRFLAGCDAACPTAAEYPALPPARVGPAWEERRRLLADLPRMVGVAPSRWMAGEARAGLWARHRVEVIPNGLSLARYRPYPRAEARRALGIPADLPVLLAAAPDLADRRKGGPLLVETLRRRPLPPCTLLTMGAGRLPPPGEHVRLHPLGYIAGEERQALVYSAADLLVHPAPHDNLPNTTLEALACGTPVVALPSGGMPEIVRPGLTGWLAATPTAEGLGQALAGALAGLAGPHDLREACRAVAVAEYGAELMAQRYVELYAV